MIINKLIMINILLILYTYSTYCYYYDWSCDEKLHVQQTKVYYSNVHYYGDFTFWMLLEQ